MSSYYRQGTASPPSPPQALPRKDRRILYITILISILFAFLPVPYNIPFLALLIFLPWAAFGDFLCSLSYKTHPYEENVKAHEDYSKLTSLAPLIPIAAIILLLTVLFI